MEPRLLKSRPQDPLLFSHTGKVCGGSAPGGEPGRQRSLVLASDVAALVSPNFVLLLPFHQILRFPASGEARVHEEFNLCLYIGHYLCLSRPETDRVQELLGKFYLPISGISRLD